MGAGVTEEEIRASVDKSFDMFAPGGGFAWCGGFRGPVDDQVIIRKNAIQQKYVEEKCHSYYKN